VRKQERERRAVYRYIIDEHPSEHHISKKPTQTGPYSVSSMSIEGFL
jgi:hypothetical protein